MHISHRVLAGCVVLVMSLTACGGGSSSIPGTGANGLTPQSQSAPSTPLISVPQTSGALAFTDLGRRLSNSPVSITMTLRYNNQAQLDQFVAAQSGPGGSHQFLTPAQFNSMYAPTAQQEQAVVNALQAAGFTVTHRYSNRTVVDASAPSSVVENFFSTEIHRRATGQVRSALHERQTGDRAGIDRFVREHCVT